MWDKLAGLRVDSVGSCVLLFPEGTLGDPIHKCGRVWVGCEQMYMKAKDQAQLSLLRHSHLMVYMFGCIYAYMWIWVHVHMCVGVKTRD